MFPQFYSRKKKAYYKKEGDKWVCDDIVAPIENEIPRFVDSGSYASLFGDQWKEYKKTQLDSFTGTTISERRMDRCLGELKDDLKNKTVLEAGCGAGRFTEVLIKKDPYLVSSDISSAVEVNKENFPLTDKHIVVQADINDMPFEDESFDVVVCMGVIQHTPSSEETIENLYRLVKKGGTLVIDHYTLKLSYLFRTASLYRFFLKRQPSSKTIPFTQRMVKRHLPLHKKLSKNKILSVLLNRFSPVITYYKTLPELKDEHQEQWSLLDTHDSLTDWYKHFISKRRMKTILKKLGAEIVYIDYNGNGVEARCKKPN